MIVRQIPTQHFTDFGWGSGQQNTDSQSHCELPNAKGWMNYLRVSDTGPGSANESVNPLYTGLDY